MRSIVIINQKGGCGKTTTAINLAAVFARRGARTLLVDMDPQSHCAAGLAVPEDRIDAGVGEALIAEHDASLDPRRLLWEVGRNFYLLPSTTRLAALEAPGGGLHELPDRDRRLESLLTLLAPRFDVCFIDCPPTIGLLTFNALRAAREAIIPVETGFFSLRGAQKQWKTIQRLIERIQRPIVCHLLPTLHVESSQNACNVLAALKREFSSRLLPTVVREHELLREAVTYGQPIIEYAPGSDAGRDFEAIAEWLEERAAMAPTIEVFAQSPAPMTDNRAAIIEPLPARLEDGETESSGRAGELARRMREIAKLEDQPQQGRPPAPPGPHLRREMRCRERRFGVVPCEGGVRFVQPGDLPRSISVAGDFNGWRPRQTPLRYNFNLGVYEVFVPLPEGRYEYLLVIDDVWQSDPNNDQHTPLGRGMSSTFEVRTEHARTIAAGPEDLAAENLVAGPTHQ